MCALELLDADPERENEIFTQIEKDVGRTFPEHKFLARDHYGHIGQKLLGNTLKAYSLYNPTVGYCQSLNFVLGFMLLVNGG